jgi:hypothetical protein
MLMEFKKNPTPEALHNTCTGLTAATTSCCSGSPTRGLSVLAADNYAVELFSTHALESDHSHAMLPLHEHCLFKNASTWRAVVLHAACQMAARAQAQPLPAHRPAAAGRPARWVAGTPVATSRKNGKKKSRSLRFRIRIGAQRVELSSAAGS